MKLFSQKEVMWRKKTFIFFTALQLVVFSNTMGCKKKPPQNPPSTPEQPISNWKTRVPNIPSFKSIPLPTNDAEKRKILASSEFTEQWETYPIGYHTLLKSGDRLGFYTFGLLVDREGKPLTDAKGKPRISNYPDFSSIISRYKKPIFMFTHFEEVPGAIYQTKLAREFNDWTLKAKETYPISTKEVGGVWLPCSGVTTKWNTHLGSEEFPPDAKAFEQAQSIHQLDPRIQQMATYFGAKPNSLQAIKKEVNPYRYGFAFEIAMDDQNKASIQKRYALGRMSQEIAYIMPDKSTIYLTDDGKNGGLYMFVSVMPPRTSLENRLSYGGTLYAMKWNQTSNKNGGKASIEWIDLGFANDQMITKAIESNIQFSDIFESAKPNEQGNCPIQFRAVHSSYGPECLQVKSKMHAIASRLETNRYAAYLGATTEIQKGEGLTFDAAKGTMYFSVSEIAAGMEDKIKNNQLEKFGPNHIRLPQNPCGAVYAIKVKPNKEIESRYVAQSIEAEIVGKPQEHISQNGIKQTRCDTKSITNPDNITFGSYYNILFIGEDSNHPDHTDVVWAYNLDSKKLERIQTTPYGAEVSGLSWQTIGATHYLMSTIQHPYIESDRDKLRHPEELRATVGYLGPFPILRH